MAITAISDDENRNSLTTLREIQGRIADIIYDTHGRMLTPLSVAVNLRKFNSLKKWQFIQENKNEYVLKVEGALGIYRKEDFVDALKKILGEDANIEIQYVTEIPELKSGKLRHTICNYVR